jgi:hypothetical protein
MSFRRILRARRGVSLIEGLTASVVLLAGLIGVFQGVIVASRQNSVAGRMQRGAAIASEVREAMEAQGRRRLTDPGGVFTQCSTSIDALTDGLSTLAPTCIVDLDAVDGAVTEDKKLVPSYKEDADITGSTARVFRRVIVYWKGTYTYDGKGNVPDRVTVLVSFRELGRTLFIRQTAALYNSAPQVYGCTDCGNGAGVDL